MKTERTKVDNVTREILELRLIDGQRGDVESVVAVVNPDGDLGSPVDFTKLTVVGIPPLPIDFVKQFPENGVVLMHVVQVGLLANYGSGVLPARLDLQILQLPSKSNGIAEPRVNGVIDLLEATTETAVTADKDTLRVGGVVVVMGGGDEGGNVNPRARARLRRDFGSVRESREVEFE